MDSRRAAPRRDGGRSVERIAEIRMGSIRPRSKIQKEVRSKSWLSMRLDLLSAHGGGDQSLAQGSLPPDL